MVDVTTLEGADTPRKVRALSAKALRPGPADFPDRRLVPGSKVSHPNGVYEAAPEYFDPTLKPADRRLEPKAGNGGDSTFFPDDWTPAQVDNAVSGASKNSTSLPGNMLAVGAVALSAVSRPAINSRRGSAPSVWFVAASWLSALAAVLSGGSRWLAISYLTFFAVLILLWLAPLPELVSDSAEHVLAALSIATFIAPALIWIIVAKTVPRLTGWSQRHLSRHH